MKRCADRSLFATYARHTAGFYNGTDHTPVAEIYRAADPADKANTLAQEVRKLASVPLLFQPGSRWLYGPSVDVQAYLVERLSGMPFDKYLEQTVFEPLGMKNTRYVLRPQDRARIAAMYDWHEDGSLTRMPDEQALEFNSRDWPMKPGSYGLVSTLDDYMRFARMLQNGGELDGKRILTIRRRGAVGGDPAGHRAQPHCTGSRDEDTGNPGWLCLAEPPGAAGHGVGGPRPVE
jgi:CubicO group peptidase (beta-lactamase class C family)